MLEAYLPIAEQVKYYNCSDFPFNFNLIGMRPADLRPLSAQSVLHQIHTWLDNTPKEKVPNWVVSMTFRSYCQVCGYLFAMMMICLQLLETG